MNIHYTKITISSSNHKCWNSNTAKNEQSGTDNFASNCKNTFFLFIACVQCGSAQRSVYHSRECAVYMYSVY
jgi:hypothetical protein